MGTYPPPSRIQEVFADVKVDLTSWNEALAALTAQRVGRTSLLDRFKAALNLPRHRYYTDYTGRIRRTPGMKPIIRKGLRA